MGMEAAELRMIQMRRATNRPREANLNNRLYYADRGEINTLTRTHRHDLNTTHTHTYQDSHTPSLYLHTFSLLASTLTHTHTRTLRYEKI